MKKAGICLYGELQVRQQVRKFHSIIDVLRNSSCFTTPHIPLLISKYSFMLQKTFYESFAKNIKDGVSKY